VSKPLQIIGLSADYGELRAVRSVDLHLETGAIGCLLGPSGCGKTTLLRTVSGFVTASEGSVIIGERLVSGDHVHVPPEERKVGMVFQDFALFPHLNVRSNIAFGLRQLHADQQRDVVDEMLSLTGMSSNAQAMPHELSGGQQQRVALARALAPEPALLLLDEPFSGLDASLREQLAREVRDLLKERHVTALMVTHDQHEAMAIADQVTLMQGGSIEQTATPYELYHCPATEFAASFIGGGNFIHLRTDDHGNATGELSMLALPAGLPANAHLKLLIRPDDVRADTAGELSLPVRHRAFQGAQVLYELALPDGQLVICAAPSHTDASTGPELMWSLDLRHLVHFPVSPPT